jgi:hypothetical protein
MGCEQSHTQSVVEKCLTVTQERAPYPRILLSPAGGTRSEISGGNLLQVPGTSSKSGEENDCSGLHANWQLVDKDLPELSFNALPL